MRGTGIITVRIIRQSSFFTLSSTFRESGHRPYTSREGFTVDNNVHNSTRVGRDRDPSRCEVGIESPDRV